MALVNSLRLVKQFQPGSSECIPAQHPPFANTVSTIITEPSPFVNFSASRSMIGPDIRNHRQSPLNVAGGRMLGPSKPVTTARPARIQSPPEASNSTTGAGAILAIHCRHPISEG